MATDDHAGAFVFGIDVERARRSPEARGRGTALALDCDWTNPVRIRLSLFADSRGCQPGAEAIPLSWSCSSGDPLSVTEIPSVTMLIDTSSSAPSLRCVLHLHKEDRPLDVEVVESGRETFSRNKAIIESDLLANKSVLCIGVGSGGSAAVEQLARAGVGRFTLWDRDRLEVHNVGRHVCTLRDLGRLKTRALREHLLAINPQAQIDCCEDDVLAQAGEGGRLARAIEASDCVLVGTDNNASRFVINDLAWKLRKPSFYGRAFTRAAGGDVIQVQPERATPCYACHVRERVVAEEVSSSKDAARVAYADAPVPIEPGLNIDIQPLSNMLARLVLLRLGAGVASGLASVAEELDAPLYLWANRREQQFQRWSPMERSFSRLAILRWYGISTPSDPECTTCGRFQPV